MTRLWMSVEIAFDAQGGLTSQVVDASRRRKTTAQPVQGLTLDRIEPYAAAVRDSARAHKALSRELRQWGRDLCARVFSGEVGQLLQTLRGEAGDAPVLVRIVARDPRLRAVPWEAMEGPGATEGALASHPRFHPVRDVLSPNAAEPREVRGAVRVLAVATAEMPEALPQLRAHLDPLIATGAVEWLPPVTGAGSLWRPLQQALTRTPRPHVLHIVTHGRLVDGEPQLLLSPSGDNEHWVAVELITGVLATGGGVDLRLVYLQSCAGADPGATASAAERIAAEGVEAVVAHLWPVDVLPAGIVARGFYEALATPGDLAGDLAAALNTARRDAAGELGTAEFLAPVLFLRGEDPAIFDFDRRQIVPPSTGAAAGPAGPALDPRLQAQVTDVSGLLGRPHSVIVGPGIDPDGSALGQRALDEFFRAKVVEGGGLSSVMQLFELDRERQILNANVQQVLGKLHLANGTLHPVIEGLTAGARPGLWLTLLWLPLVEAALAFRHPEADILVLQPPAPDRLDHPWVYRRRPHAAEWESLFDDYTERPDLEKQFVVVRLYGGFPADSPAIAGNPVLTEDDQLAGLANVELLSHQILAWLRQNPTLVAGLSPTEWSHRELLRRLGGGQPLANGSMATLAPATRPAERRYWESSTGPGGRAGRVNLLPYEDLVQVADVLRRLKG